MLRLLSIVLGALLLTSAFAQVPDATQSEAVQRAQIRASAAYRELTQAEYDLKIAEQDYVNTEDAYRAATKRADDIKGELEKLKQARDAAKDREARARKAYDEALDAVEKAWGRPPRSR